MQNINSITLHRHVMVFYLKDLEIPITTIWVLTVCRVCHPLCNVAKMCDGLSTTFQVLLRKVYILKPNLGEYFYLYVQNFKML